uniref:hypothetical protein n=1 Tax=uncultured Sphingomonas sp. TaxID=158754 RepID=UPI0035C9A0CE
MTDNRDPFMVTDAELRVVGLLGEAWNAFLAMPVEHSDHQDEFRHAIHAAQDLVLSRVGARQINCPGVRV